MDDSFKLTEGRIRLEIRKKFFPVGGVRYWQVAQRSCGCLASGSSPFLQKQYFCEAKMLFQLLTIIKSHKFFYFIFPVPYLEMLGLKDMLLPTDVTL